MKTLLFLLLLLPQITKAQTVNLNAETMQMRHQNQNGTWTQWDTSQCNVPITFSRDMNIITVGNALNETYSIQDKGPNQKWFESMDYEGQKLVIVIYKNPDSTYNIMLQYVNQWNGKTGQLMVCGYAYQYIHCKIINN